MNDYLGRRLRVRAYVRAYGFNTSDSFVIIGEPLAESKFPTVICTLRSSDYEKARQFRGKWIFQGMWLSALPDRAVTMDLQFLGRIEGRDVYAGRDCGFVE